MKDRFNEEVRYTPYGDHVQYLYTLRDLYPLPSAFQEVKYLSCANNDCIVIEDVTTGLSQNIGVTFKFQTRNTSNTILCGGGCHNTTAAPTSSSGGWNYVFCFWQYNDGSPSTPKFKFWSPGGQNMTESNGDPVTPDIEKIYWVNMYRVAGGKAHCELRDAQPDFIRTLRPHKQQGSLAPDVTCGPLGFFNAPFWSTYYNHYGFPYNNFATASGNNYSMGYHSAGRRIFSNAIIYNPSDMSIRKYLYTCYDKQTHQYGMYDGVDGIFYGGVREINVLNYWNDDDYYWSHMNSASGATRYEKESTFLNICGPDE